MLALHNDNRDYFQDAESFISISLKLKKILISFVWLRLSEVYDVTWYNEILSVPTVHKHVPGEILSGKCPINMGPIRDFFYSKLF